MAREQGHGPRACLERIEEKPSLTETRPKKLRRDGSFTNVPSRPSWVKSVFSCTASCEKPALATLQESGEWWGIAGRTAFDARWRPVSPSVEQNVRPANGVASDLTGSTPICLQPYWLDNDLPKTEMARQRLA